METGGKMFVGHLPAFCPWIMIMMMNGLYWPILVGSVSYASLVSASADRDLKTGSKWCGLQYSSSQQGDYTTRAYISLPWWRHIYGHLSVSIASLGKPTYIHTHIITGKRSCTIQVSAELLMTGWLCQSVPYTDSAPLHNARKTSASEVHYSQEVLYQMPYTYIHKCIFLNVSYQQESHRL